MLGLAGPVFHTPHDDGENMRKYLQKSAAKAATSLADCWRDFAGQLIQQEIAIASSELELDIPELESSLDLSHQAHRMGQHWKAEKCMMSSEVPSCLI